MIDFRYHVVSLISVFLALAVGIALGAGPLKESIGDTLTGQVEQLRTEKDELRAEIEDGAAQLDDATRYIEAAGPELLADALTDRRVAVVQLGEVDDAELAGIDESLATSGATVTAHVTLTESWTDPDLRSYRQALAGSLLEYQDPVPADDATLEEQLAQALVQGLVGADPASPDALTADAADVLAILSQGDNPLIALADPVETGADAIVVVAVPAQDPDADAATPSPEPDPAVAEAQLAVVSAAQELSEGAVLADGPRFPASLTTTVLGDDALAAALTTVSDVQSTPGQINVPLALAARIAGTNGHYGFGDDETVLPAPVTLTPVDRTPVVPEQQQEPQGQAETGDGQDSAAAGDGDAGADG